MKLHAILVGVLLSSSLVTAGSDPCCTSGNRFAAFASDKAFASSHAEPLPFRFSPAKGTWISLKVSDGKEGRAFQVLASKQTKNWILVFHEWWGLNDYIQQEAERIQSDLSEVNVLAIDLYDGRVAATREEAGSAMQSLKPARANALIQSAIQLVGSDARIGTIGWCMGGGWSLGASLQASKQGKACVIYYGIQDVDSAMIAKNLNAPILGIYGTKDQWINPGVVKKFEETVRKAGKPISTKSYDADHAFANPSNPGHNKEFTADAWARTREFFKKNLLQ